MESLMLYLPHMETKCLSLYIHYLFIVLTVFMESIHLGFKKQKMMIVMGKETD
jgi:hypothetical protein